MDERAALAIISDVVDAAGDDAAVIDGCAIAVDMLHTNSDFPAGITPYTIGWRTVAVALSDIAAVGANVLGSLAVFSPPAYDEHSLTAFLEGATDATEAVGGTYLGGDLDITDEMTTVGIGIGATDDPVTRSGATPGDAIVVTGTLGRGGLGVRLFESGDIDRANELFRITPRVDAGQQLAAEATAMIDSSDGLARSLHLLAEASGCGMNVRSADLPIDERLDEVATSPEDRRELGVFWGEDFELVATVPPTVVDELADSCPIPLRQIGTVRESGVTIDGDPLPDRGFDHG